MYSKENKRVVEKLKGIKSISKILQMDDLINMFGIKVGKGGFDELNGRNILIYFVRLGFTNLL